MGIESKFATFVNDIRLKHKGYIWARPPKRSFWKKLWDNISWAALVFDYFPDNVETKDAVRYSKPVIPGVPFQPVTYVTTENRIVRLSILLDKYPPRPKRDFFGRRVHSLVGEEKMPGFFKYSLAGGVLFRGLKVGIQLWETQTAMFSHGSFIKLVLPKFVDKIVIWQPDDIIPELEFLRALLYPTEGETVVTDFDKASPPVAKVQLGEFTFDGVLTAMDVKYLIFDQKTSNPLRAVVHLDFEVYHWDYQTYAKIMKDIKE